jgi:cardiolipin synthase
MAQVSVDESHIPHAKNCSYPPRSGNSVRPLVDGRPAFERICQAVEGASESVWLTVAFLDPAFEMPGGRGSLFDVLDRAASRGVDVRVIFWSEPDIEEQIADEGHFPASEENFDFLTTRDSRIRARWDRVRKFCQHQKSWLVDAGRPEEVAFVGGINLDRGSVVSPGHAPDATIEPGGGVHDLYLELCGPCATDVAHNFVQRWNEASESHGPHGSYPDRESAGQLPFPDRVSPRAGDVDVQISRSVLSGLYRDSHPTPGGERFAIEDGEYSIKEQYLAAIAAARRTIYFENQLLFCPEIIAALHDALEREIQVVALVPRVTMPEVIAARKHPRAAPIFDALAALGDFDHFSFVGLAANREAGRYEDIYVHAKFAAIDDCWATIGSTNTMFRSFKGDTELNASFWDEEGVRALRCELLLEHLEEDTSSASDSEAFARYREIALANRQRRALGEPMQGLVHAMAPSAWALEEP